MPRPEDIKLINLLKLDNFVILTPALTLKMERGYEMPPSPQPSRLKWKGEIKKVENEINNGNPYAGLSNSHRRNIVKASFCLSAHSARVKEA